MCFFAFKWIYDFRVLACQKNVCSNWNIFFVCLCSVLLNLFDIESFQADAISFPHALIFSNNIPQLIFSLDDCAPSHCSFIDFLFCRLCWHFSCRKYLCYFIDIITKRSSIYILSIIIRHLPPFKLCFHLSFPHRIRSIDLRHELYRRLIFHIKHWLCLFSYFHSKWISCDQCFLAKTLFD